MINIKATKSKILIPIETTPLYKIVSPDDEVFQCSLLRALYSGENNEIRWTTPAVFSKKGIYFLIISRRDNKQMNSIFTPWRNVRKVTKLGMGIIAGETDIYKKSFYYHEMLQGIETKEEFNDRIKAFNKTAYQLIIIDNSDYLNYLLNHKKDKNIYNSQIVKEIKKIIAETKNEYARLIKISN